MQTTENYDLPIFEEGETPALVGDWNSTMRKIDNIGGGGSSLTTSAILSTNAVSVDGELRWSIKVRGETATCQQFFNWVSNDLNSFTLNMYLGEGSGFESNETIGFIGSFSKPILSNMATGCILQVHIRGNQNLTIIHFDYDKNYAYSLAGEQGGATTDDQLYACVLKPE